MKVSGIYQIQSKIKHERIYIGSSVNIHNRWRDHREELRKNKHGNSKLQNHFNKYGEPDFQFSILLGCEKEDLIKHEQFFIDSINPYFNICRIAGSCMGMIHSNESKAKMSESHRNRPPVSDETRQKHKDIAILNGLRPPVLFGNKNMLGKTHTPESKLKMSMAHKGKKHSPEHIKNLTIARNKRQRKISPAKIKQSKSEAKKGENNHFFGKHLSSEHRKKISETLRGKGAGSENPFYGKRHTEEARRTMSESRKGKNNAFYGKHHTEEAKMKNRLAHLKNCG